MERRKIIHRKTSQEEFIDLKKLIERKQLAIGYDGEKKKAANRTTNLKNERDNNQAADVDDYEMCGIALVCECNQTISLNKSV